MFVWKWRKQLNGFQISHQLVFFHLIILSMDSSVQLCYRDLYVTINGPNIRASAGRMSQTHPVISFFWITLLKCWESKLLLTLYENYLSEFELQGLLMTNTSFFAWTSTGASFLLILNPAPFCWHFPCSYGLIWFPSQSPEICQTRSHSVLPSRSNTLFKLENSGVVRHWYSWMQICALVVLIRVNGGTRSTVIWCQCLSLPWFHPQHSRKLEANVT